MISDEEHQERYAEAIRASRLAGDHQFQSWFNRSENVRQSIIRGYWDFAFHILTRKVCEYITNPEEKTALEIGYGGGRILNAACSFFKETIGIDIHDEQEAVEAFLRDQGKSNFKLIKTSGRTIEVDSNSIDLVYSFIVLQHLPTYEVFTNYVKETYRCLKPGGIAQLYFGKFTKLHVIHQMRYFLQGYKEIPRAPVNHTRSMTSLVLLTSRAKKLCKNTGFKILETGTSYKTAPDGYSRIKGGQNYITLLKPVM